MEIIQVVTEEQLDECIKHASQQEIIALDLEFDKNLHRYGFNLCLIQIQVAEISYLIDPLVEEMNYKRIFPILENPEIEKIVFAFGEDLRLLNSLSCYPKNIYDISITTSLLNFEPGSLGRYLSEVLDIQVTKSAQLSNWYTRPLKNTQVSYAAEDVQYLLEMKNKLNEQVLEKNMSAWIDEENALFDDRRYDIDYETAYLKDKDKKGLTEFQWYLLSKFLAHREEKAKKMNRPSFQVLDINFLKDIVHDHTVLKNWTFTKGAIKSLRNQATKRKLLDILEETEKNHEAENISKSAWAKKGLSGIAYKEHLARKKEVEEIKKTYFKPIQNLIKQEYGDHASTFLLSNKLILKIIDGDVSDIPRYKLKLCMACAKELKINISAFVELD